MAGLKALVIAMGIAIIIAATVLITVMIQRAGRMGGAPVTAAIELPAGARVVETRIEGGRILLRVALTGGGQQILIIDAETGARLATHDLMRKGKAR